MRVAAVALASWATFSFLLIPMKTRGGSMEPTYPEQGFNFCLVPRFLWGGPDRHDVVVVRLSGNKVFYLKRVVAFAGETVSFVDGVLHVDGRALEEPYVVFPCHWNLPPRLVDQGYVYVVGDNRSVPMDDHLFGQTQINRIAGGPLW